MSRRDNQPSNPAAQTEPHWWAAALNRRARVEQWMFDAARGKRPMPTAEELRAWALKLGTPEPGEPAPQWPAGLLDRVKAAEQRIQDNQAPRRIPADPHGDVDLVLAEVRYLIEGKWPPFWIKDADGVKGKS